MACEHSQPRGRHLARFDQLFHPRDVRVRPLALGLARREALHETLLVQAFLHAVDPAEAERFLHRLFIFDARFAGAFLVVHEPDFGFRRAVLFEPCAPLSAVLRVERFHRKKVNSPRRHGGTEKHASILSMFCLVPQCCFSIQVAMSQPSSVNSKLPMRTASPTMRCVTGSRATRLIHCGPTWYLSALNHFCGSTSTSPACG